MCEHTTFQIIGSFGQAAVGRASKPGRCAARAFRALCGTAVALVGLTSPAGAGQVVAQTGTESPTVTIEADRSEYAHGVDDVWFTLTRTGSVDEELYVTVTVSQTQNLSGIIPLRQPLRFSLGAASTRWRINRTHFLDTATQSGDVIVRLLLQESDYTVGTPSSATVRMVVADPAVTVRMEHASYRFAEGEAGTSVLVLARTAAGLPQPNVGFGVELSTQEVSGSATPDTDYTSLLERMEFAPSDFTLDGDAWQARKEVTLAIADDTDDETQETLYLLLEFSPGYPGRAVLVEADGQTACGRGCIVLVTIEDNDATPTAPQGLTLEPGAGAVALGWEAPADDGGSAVTRYQYRVSADDGATWAPDWTDIAHSAPGEAQAAAYLVMDLDSETTYRFELRAVNANGEGASVAGTATPLETGAVTRVKFVSLPKTYAIGNTIRVKASFSAEVEVVTSPTAGPYIELDVGGSAKTPPMVDGAGLRAGSATGYRCSAVPWSAPRGSVSACPGTTATRASVAVSAVRGKTAGNSHSTSRGCAGISRACPGRNTGSDSG